MPEYDHYEDYDSDNPPSSIIERGCECCNDDRTFELQSIGYDYNGTAHIVDLEYLCAECNKSYINIMDCFPHSDGSGIYHFVESWVEKYRKSMEAE